MDVNSSQTKTLLNSSLSDSCSIDINSGWTLVFHKDFQVEKEKNES